MDDRWRTIESHVASKWIGEAQLSADEPAMVVLVVAVEVVQLIDGRQGGEGLPG